MTWYKSCSTENSGDWIISLDPYDFKRNYMGLFVPLEDVKKEINPEVVYFDPKELVI